MGRKFKGGKFERQLNRALFEVQAYYLSAPKVRAAAVKAKTEIAKASKQLFTDRKFLSSIESTTKSVENYRIRFSKFQAMLQKTLEIEVEPVEFGSAQK